jgi:hypothetical protein
MLIEQSLFGINPRLRKRVDTPENVLRAASNGYGASSMSVGLSAVSHFHPSRHQWRGCGVGIRSAHETERPIVQIQTHAFADLVIMAGWLHPIPFRTRP